MNKNDSRSKPTWFMEGNDDEESGGRSQSNVVRNLRSSCTQIIWTSLRPNVNTRDTDVPGHLNTLHILHERKSNILEKLWHEDIRKQINQLSF